MRVKGTPVTEMSNRWKGEGEKGEEELVRMRQRRGRGERRPVWAASWLNVDLFAATAVATAAAASMNHRRHNPAENRISPPTAAPCRVWKAGGVPGKITAQHLFLHIPF